MIWYPMLLGDDQPIGAMLPDDHHSKRVIGAAYEVVWRHSLRSGLDAWRGNTHQADEFIARFDEQGLDRSIRLGKALLGGNHFPR